MKKPSLDAVSAAAFIARLGEHIEHNINIMDREGVIIASRDPGRVGRFHDAARRLVATGAAIERVQPGTVLPPGVKPGVNLPIAHRSETVGVVGVTGDPAMVEPLAYAVKTSVETMLELEAWKEKALKRQDRKNRLVNLLLYDDDAPSGAAEQLARALGFDPGLPRVPVAFAPPRGLDAQDALAAVKGTALHGSQDISAVTSEGLVLVFKALGAMDGAFLSALETRVRDYAAAAAAAMAEAAPGGGPGLGCWAGAPQTELGRYRAAYRQLMWLAELCPSPSRGSPVFLHDRLVDYLAARVHRDELVAALDGALGLFPPGLVPETAAAMEALADAGLNLKEAASRLGVHRNTLTARLDRLTELLGRDPRRDARAFDYLRLLARYAELEAPRSAQKPAAVRGAHAAPPEPGHDAIGSRQDRP